MSVWLRRVWWVALVSALLCARMSRADKVDELTRTLMQDPSYKVRVQAALILGKIADKRAVPTLIRALKDDNETVRGVAATSLGRIGDQSARSALEEAQRDASTFVSSQAQKALAQLSAGGPGPGPRAGAKFYLAIGFAGGKTPQYSEIIRAALQKEFASVAAITLSVGGSGEPSASVLSSKKLQGFIVDGSIAKVSAMNGQIDCDLKAYVATFPGRAIKMMTQEGASLTVGSGPAQEMSGKRECLEAAAQALKDDVAKFLQTQ